MWAFSVWGPKAKTVGVRIRDAHGHHQDFALQRGKDDWWIAEVDLAERGTDYLFVVNGESAVPDPRSRWQPEGVHGPSRIFQHSAFRWTDAKWQPPPLPSAVIYELHIGTFTQQGTFDSAIERLSYLKELGISHVELMPVNEFSGDWGWGYDGVDLFAPHHSYGGPEALKRLVDACHEHGLAVLLDVVYNHLGPTGNYLGLFGPYFTNHYSTPWGEAINLDGEDSIEVRRFLCDNALMWLRDYHFDGLRLDAIHALVDHSAIHFLEQLASEVQALSANVGKSKVLIAESDLNDPRVVNPREVGGFGVDAQWSDDYHHALHSALTGETSGYYEDFGGTAPIAKALQDTFVHDGRRSQHRRRVHGRSAGAVSSHRFLGYLQTHDQVGNRMKGERISHLVSPERAKIGAALVILSPFIPMIFQGEEFGASSPFQYFTHHKEKELAAAVTEGRTKEFAAFGWNPRDVPDPQNPDTFQRSKLNWAELEDPTHSDMLEWYRELFRLRRHLPEISAERNQYFVVKSGDGWLHAQRGRIAIFCNVSPRLRTFAGEMKGEILLVSGHASAEDGVVTMPSDSLLVFATSRVTA